MEVEKTNNHLSKEFKILKSGHLVTDCQVNGVSAKLIIDTGASNSCIDSNSVEKFKIKIENYDEQASSATEKIKNMYISQENSIDIVGFSIENLKLFVFDMGHINETLKENESIKIHGIIGNDIMSKHEAIINFTENKIYLKLNI
tara:strand:- start:9268 stop:9702 length:435 start_codon:yes stop_codon:yes gene_type:complete